MARRRIGELLVEDGACTAEAVRAALRDQVIFGGRLGTNLLELGAVEEGALARALGRRHAVRWVSGPVRLEPEAVRALPAALADRLEVVPVRLLERGIAVLACDPSNLATLDEVAFATGREVQAAVAPEARIWALLRSAYGVVRQLRGIDVELDEGGRPAAARRAPERPVPAADLMDEAGFEELYGRLRSGPAVAPAEEPILELTDEVVEPVPVEDGPPGSPGSPGFLGFDDALRALGEAAEREAIARIVLRYARNRLARVVLFTVRRDLAQGWVGMGQGLRADGDARAIRLRLGTPGVLDTVVRTRAHYLGPLPRAEANVRLLRALGGGVPGNALVVPILALGRVVNLLYADGGRGALVDAEGVGELLILATRIAQSYEALVAGV